MMHVIAFFALFGVAMCQNNNNHTHNHHEGTEFFCNYVKTHNCNSSHSTEEVCATNKQTYTNNCYLSKAHCDDRSIHLTHVGACTKDDLRTTPSHEELVHGADIVYDVFCIHISHNACIAPTKAETVCGTNDRTYLNYCEYEKAHCTHHDLHVASYGNCTA